MTVGIGELPLEAYGIEGSHLLRGCIWVEIEVRG